MLSLSNLWRVGLLLAVIAAVALGVKALTDDDGVLPLVAVVVVLPVVGALWPAALGLKQPPPSERRPDAPERRNGSPRA